MLIRPVHALSRDESVLLARELPNLRELLHHEAEPVRGGTADIVLGRRVDRTRHCAGEEIEDLIRARLSR